MAASRSDAAALFAGRDAELAALRVALNDAIGGRGRLALIAGEPGIGKTRLAEELTEAAREAGALVLWGRCYEGEGAPAFWPWVQILRACFSDMDPASLTEVLGPDGAGGIVGLVPEIAAHMHGPRTQPTGATLDPASERFRLFDRIAGLFVRLSARSPVVLVLDDLHWADTPSLLLLEFLAQQVCRPLGGTRGPAVLLIGAYRDTDTGPDHPLGTALARLARLPRLLRLDLGGLAGDAVRRLVEQAAGGPVPPAVAATIARDTDGNPFFVGEMVRYHTRAGATAAPWWQDMAARSPVPPAVREVLELRLARLSPPCRTVLTHAAIIGREFSLRALEAICDGAADQVLAAVAEAEIARVLIPRQAPGTYRFTHALIREALYDGLPTARRIALHAQAGEALERLWGDDGEHLAELAHHFLRAAASGGSERAVRYARRTAQRALALLAYEEAVRYYQHAVDALALVTPADREERCRALLDLAETQQRAGDQQAAISAFERAAELARSLYAAASLHLPHQPSDVAATLLARAALGVGAFVQTAGPTHVLLINLLREAIACLGEGDSAPRAMTLARLAQELAFAGEPEQASALSRTAVAVARRTGDRRALVFCLVARAYALTGAEELTERETLAAELLRLSDELHDPELTLRASRWQIAVLIERCLPVEVDAAIATVERTANALRQPRYQLEAAEYRVMQALVRGDVVEAERLVEQARAMQERTAFPDTSNVLDLYWYAIRREQGRGDEIEESVRRARQRYPGIRTFHGLLALLLCELGRDDEARAEFDPLATAGFSGLTGERAWLPRAAYLAQVCAWLGDGPRAALLYDRLLPFADRIAVNTAIVCLGPMARYLGLLAGAIAAAGLPLPSRNGPHTGAAVWSVAAGHFEDAIALSHRLGARGLAAHAEYDYAMMLLSQRAAGFGEGGPLLDRARILLAHAGETARLLSMTRLAALADTALDDLTIEAHADTIAPHPRPASPVTAPAGALPDGLTAREAEVLALIASGRTTREVAAELVVAIDTVRRHIANVYGKIGARGRADATAYAIRHGLTRGRVAGSG